MVEDAPTNSILSSCLEPPLAEPMQRRILIIEDDRFQREALKAMLENMLKRSGGVEVVMGNSESAAYAPRRIARCVIAPLSPAAWSPASNSRARRF